MSKINMNRAGFFLLGAFFGGWILGAISSLFRGGVAR